MLECLAALPHVLCNCLACAEFDSEHPPAKSALVYHSKATQARAYKALYILSCRFLPWFGHRFFFL